MAGSTAGAVSPFTGQAVEGRQTGAGYRFAPEAGWPAHVRMIAEVRPRAAGGCR